MVSAITGTSPRRASWSFSFQHFTVTNFSDEAREPSDARTNISQDPPSDYCARVVPTSQPEVFGRIARWRGGQTSELPTPDETAAAGMSILLFTPKFPSILYRNSYCLVDRTVRDLIERLEPRTHKFLPLGVAVHEVTGEKTTHYSFLLIQQEVQALDRSKILLEEEDPSPILKRFADYRMLHFLSPLIVDVSKIKGKTLWREPAPILTATFCSLEFAKELDRLQVEQSFVLFPCSAA
jgi:hypothetical protein